MHTICELCRNESLQSVYVPERTTRNITVHLCTHCGLVQSLPRADRAPRAPASVSGGADWGNVRYGKGFRAKIALDAVLRHVGGEFSLLDVGSNRGSFARALLEASAEVHITAVEPDERVAQSVADLPRTELLVARIEDTPLETGRFDVVQSCHTLEHVADPARVLADHHRVLKDGGLLVLDVPNIAIIASDDIVEEWFIDKHLTHFSANTLSRMIVDAGFEIIEAPDATDLANLFIVARKMSPIAPDMTADPQEVESARALFAAYFSNRTRNLEALETVAAELSTIAPQGLAIWGAGRIFDSLVVHGGFDARKADLLIDSHLKNHVSERQDAPLSGLDALLSRPPHTLVVMSRGFAGEIEAEARRLAPRARILHYADLLSRARLRLAA